MIDTIMLMAAGKGTRMRELGENTPKSLLKIHNKYILYYALELCASYPFKKIVINTHYFPEAIEEALEGFRKQNPKFPEIITIYEDVLLETGGGIKNAIKLLGNDPIFKMNTDVILQSKENMFEQILRLWDAKKMDFLLLLQPYDKAVGYRGNGDFELDQEGKIFVPKDDKCRKYMFTGLEILKPALIAQNQQQVFSLKDYYFSNNKVYGCVAKDMNWYHATTPADLVEIEKQIAI